jgi:hypothetical protein
MPILTDQEINEFIHGNKNTKQSNQDTSLLSLQEIDDILHGVDIETDEYQTLTEIIKQQKEEINSLITFIKKLKNKKDL